MRRNDAVAAAGPHHRNLLDVGLATLAVLHQHTAERLVGENAGEVVDAAIAFGLADHGDDFVGGELPLFDGVLHAGRVRYGLQFDFDDLNSHSMFLD